jgi:hypothetical protein
MPEPSYSNRTIYKRPVEILQNLIRFDTTNPPGNEAECVSYVNRLLSEAGFTITLLAKDPNRPNLITCLKGQGNAPPFLLYGHADVVTTLGQVWTHPPFEGKIVDGNSNIRKGMQEVLNSGDDWVQKAKYLHFEETLMYTMRESELIQQYLQEHGKLPEGNEDLF